MATQGTKAELINGAFSQLRISGITIIPSPTELVLALRRLESTIAELFALNIRLPYNFEEEPDLNSPHNLERKFWDSLEVYLAYRLAPDFGKEIGNTFASRLKGATSTLFKLSAQANLGNKIDYPSRMPKGKVNELQFPFQTSFTEPTFIPNKSSVIEIYIGDRNSFIESFLQQLNEGEVISSYTIEVDGDEITINSDSNTDSAVSFDITATGDSIGSTMLVEMKIQITTDASRLITRILNFKLMESEI